jgi:ankyrin repeat protein
MRVMAKGAFLGGALVLLAAAAVAADGPDRRLADAAKHRDLAAVRALVAQRADVNVPQPDGATALHWASHWDDVETAALLMSAGANVNAADDYGVTPLSLACTNGSAPMVEALLTAGANPNAAPASGATPLMTAARSGSLAVVTNLLVRGADVNARESSRAQTALMWAVSQQHPDVVKALIENGADVKAKSKGGFTPLLFAARNGNVEIGRLLLAAGASVEDASPEGSVLIIATMRGHAPFVKLALDNGGNPNVATAGFTALHWAAGSWETELFGVDGIKENLPGDGYLGGLLGDTKIDIVRMLLAHGADPNARLTRRPPRVGFGGSRMNIIGATPFVLAAAAGDATVMRMLADGGADPRATTNRKTTAAIASAGLGRETGETRVTEAASLEALKLALDLGNDVDAVDADGETIAHSAAYIGADSIIQFLAERGAPLTLVNKEGWTPLRIAQGVYLGAIVPHPTTEALLRRLTGDTSPSPSTATAAGR